MSLAPRIDSLKASAANLIINGNMDIWQRGVSFSSPAAGVYTADRFTTGNLGLGGGTMTIAQSTDVPNQNSRYSLGVTVGTAYTVDPAAAAFGITHKIEGNDAKLLYNQTATLSFWAKCSVVGTYHVWIWNAGTAQLIVPFTVANTNWNQYTISLGTISTAIGSGWVYDNTAGLQIYITLASGTTYQNATTNSWFSNASPFSASSTQTNTFFSTAGATFKLSQVQLNQGAYAQNFTLAGGTIAGELAMCQRYYEKSYEILTAPGTVTFTGVCGINVGTANTGAKYAFVSYKVTKRTAVSPTIYTPSTLNTSGKVNNGGTDRTSAVDVYSSNGFDAGTSDTSNTSYMNFHWTTEAEL